MNRRDFLATGLAALGSVALPDVASVISPTPDEPRVMTVTGPIVPSEMGRTLSHEHVMVDFAGVDVVGPHRYDRDEVVEKVQPYLADVAEAGGQTFVDCTPAYLGRDPLVLRRLSQATGVQILTNTGYYGARDDQHIPQHAYDDSVDALAGRWVQEWKNGIGETDVRPGFLKIGVDSGSLSDIDRKLVRAACRAHRQTGLTIAVHTGPAKPAFEQLDVLEEEGIDPRAWIWVHAQGEKGTARHLEVARRGGWVSMDGYEPKHTERYVRVVTAFRENNLLDRLLLSHDNGWYSVGESEGGSFAPYTTLFTDLVPALRNAGLSEADVRQLLVKNPADAFAIRPRTTD